MKTLILLTLTLISLSFTACINKHGISAKLYSDCNEYYDLQGYYHKDCNDDIITYEEIEKNFTEPKTKNTTKNVW